MNRRKFFKRLAIGMVAIVAAPKVIDAVTSPEYVITGELRRKIERRIDELKGQQFLFSTAEENDPGAFKWAEPNYLDKYKIIKIKARRKGMYPQSLIPFIR